MYVIVFDFDTELLKSNYPGPSWNNAYDNIRRYLSVSGFTWMPGSTYFGDDSVDAVRCVRVVQKLARKYACFTPSIRDIRMLRIEENNDLRSHSTMMTIEFVAPRVSEVENSMSVSSSLSSPDAGASVRETSVCVPIALTDWHAIPDAAMRRDAVGGLERGDVVLFPSLPFTLSPDEARLLESGTVAEGTKTVKYDPDTGRVWGYAAGVDAAAVKSMMARYADYTRGLLDALIPTYGPALKIGNTSFRPVEAQGRDQSKRHDDTRLHVDAFPSRPSHGERIMRVFTNVHPGTKPRVWRVGEPFGAVAERFLPKIAAPIPGSAKLMNLVGITKSVRSAADHYMLKLHDRMKLDDAYQSTVPHQTIAFAPGSTWMAFTDQVSHAAVSGQHALEQTFTLTVEGMANPEQAPVRVLERMKGRKLH